MMKKMSKSKNQYPIKEKPSKEYLQSLEILKLQDELKISRELNDLLRRDLSESEKKNYDRLREIQDIKNNLKKVENTLKSFEKKAAFLDRYVHTQAYCMNQMVNVIEAMQNAKTD